MPRPMPPAEPLVSIIIPCFDQVGCTRACWQALQTTLPAEVAAEIILIDNGSRDGTAAFLETLDHDTRVSVITNPENQGFARSCNAGARKAAGQFLLLLNNDTEAQAGWLEPLLETLGRNPKAAIVGSKLLYPDGTIQHAGMIIEERPVKTGRKGPAWLRVQHIHRFDPADAPWANEEQEYQCVTGACLLIRREVFARLGGFDERFLNGYEDVDLCFRARELGYTVIYCPKSVLLHHESVSAGRHAAETNNAHLLTERWADKIIPDERSAYSAAGKLDWLELRLSVEELKGFVEEVREHEAWLPGSKQRGLGASLQRMGRRLLGLEPLARELRTVRSTLIRAGRSLESLQRLLQAMERKALSGRTPIAPTGLDQPPCQKRSSTAFPIRS